MAILTIPALKNLFRDGQANGTIPVSAVRDLIDTMESYDRGAPVRRPVANRPVVHGGAMSNGTDTSATYRHRFVVPRECSDLQLVYGNWLLHAFTPQTLNDITVRAGVEVNGVVYPVFFNGRRSAVLEPDATLSTDPLGITIPSGTTIYVRSYVSVSSGQKWPTGLRTNAADGEGVTVGSDLSGVTTAVTTASVEGFAPVNILGIPGTTAPAILGVGDSITEGDGDDGGRRAWLVRGLNDQVACVRAAKGSARVIAYVDPASLVAGGKHLHDVAAGCTHAVVLLGTNDLVAGRTLSQIQTDLVTVWTHLARRGMSVWAATLPPVSTSTDGWATVGNQTPASAYGAGGVYTQLNAWIRTMPAPLAGVVETGNAVASAQDSGRWAANMTADGTHPTPAGHAAMGAALNLAAILAT